MKPKYGAIHTTQTLDENGSTKTIHENYNSGKITGNSKEYYEIRHKVSNDLEIAAQFNAFHREVVQDTTMLDPSFSIVGRNRKEGGMFTINCFTRIIH